MTKTNSNNSSFSPREIDSELEGLVRSQEDKKYISTKKRYTLHLPLTKKQKLY